jgi:hypothetical protein
MFRYKLRTLMIVLALGPPMLAGVWFAYDEYCFRELMREAESDGRSAVFTSRGPPYVDLIWTSPEEQAEADRLANEALLGSRR